jgi:putative DNA primase/helicase
MALDKWEAKCEMKATIEAAVGLARKMLTVDGSALDRDPWLLNCLNGTVDLRTGAIRDHDPADFITKLVNVKYVPSARCDLWLKVLGQVTLEDGRATQPMAQFMQRWFGYCATGLTREQVFVVHYGAGSNGKSTVLDMVADVLGEYAGTAAPGLMVGAGRERHPTEIADLFGRRMVTAHETSEGGVLREDFVKQATGSDKIKARYMREDFFEFAPTHKLQLLTNHKPIIKGQDHGIWRRVLLLPYMARFGAVEEVRAGRAHFRKDVTLFDRLLAEREGVLAWIVRGAVQWAADGLQPPDTVLAASKDYQSEQDRIGQFITECCELGPAFSEPLTAGMGAGLYVAYSEWCREGGIMALAKNRFLAEIERAVPGCRVEEVKMQTSAGRRLVRKIWGVRVLSAE